MLAETFAALAMSACFPLYEQTNSVAVVFSEDSVELTEESRRQVTAIVRPMVGNPLAEVELQAYFPYGTRQGGQPVVTDATQVRVDAVTNSVIEAGMSAALVGAHQFSIGEEGMFPFSPERLRTVEINVRVKADCHPLTASARRLDPYR